MIRRLQPGEVRHGYLYAASAISSSPFSLDVYLAVSTDIGFKFVPADMFDIDLSTDGPHEVSALLNSWAQDNGWTLDPDDIWCPWSEREALKRALDFAPITEISVNPVHPIVLEAERILMEAVTPDGQGSLWLRHSEHWRGSSLHVLYDPDGGIAEAVITLTTKNANLLKVLLRWLGMPKDLINKIARPRKD